ncbi:hypothetical protein EYF80_004528 [Liparis tanakae]|uniref:Uncharacterized protein n=1 Tax=Liparis tanakae TaxID=230148 RepID=A0A4Z2J698_9TELE|nr:hypothetical protein EYF80_004528 [Liparis tanakae]
MAREFKIEEKHDTPRAAQAGRESNLGARWFHSDSPKQRSHSHVSPGGADLRLGKVARQKAAFF